MYAHKVIATCRDCISAKETLAGKAFGGIVMCLKKEKVIPIIIIKKINVHNGNRQRTIQKQIEY